MDQLTASGGATLQAQRAVDESIDAMSRAYLKLALDALGSATDSIALEFLAPSITVQSGYLSYAGPDFAGAVASAASRGAPASALRAANSKRKEVNTWWGDAGWTGSNGTQDYRAWEQFLLRTAHRAVTAGLELTALGFAGANGSYVAVRNVTNGTVVNGTTWSFQSTAHDKAHNIVLSWPANLSARLVNYDPQQVRGIGIMNATQQGWYVMAARANRTVWMPPRPAYDTAGLTLEATLSTPVYSPGCTAGTACVQGVAYSNFTFRALDYILETVMYALGQPTDKQFESPNSREGSKDASSNSTTSSSSSSGGGRARSKATSAPTSASTRASTSAQPTNGNEKKGKQTDFSGYTEIPQPSFANMTSDEALRYTTISSRFVYESSTGVSSVSNKRSTPVFRPAIVALGEARNH